jgi:hypothetical protein
MAVMELYCCLAEQLSVAAARSGSNAARTAVLSMIRVLILLVFCNYIKVKAVLLEEGGKMYKISLASCKRDYLIRGELNDCLERITKR